MRIVLLRCLFVVFFSCKCTFSTSDGFPLFLQILYFDLEFEIAVLISFVHTFNCGFALKIALFDDEVIAADFMISQILSIFSPIGISPVTNLCLMLLIFFSELPDTIPCRLFPISLS